jgi:FtsP/CotA-like multicopper oxidase with cupredoxin domain
MSRLRLLLAPLAALMLAFPAAAGAATRTFWVGAVQTTWNVIPNERDGIMGRALPAWPDDLPDRPLPPLHAGVEAGAGQPVGGRGARDTRTVGPAESFRVRWTEDAPGTWLYHCHVEGHMGRGMIGLYRVRP